MATQTTVTVALFGEDSSFESRRHFREVVARALEQAHLGEWVGGGSMVTDEANYNIEFDVTDESQALPLIRETLRLAGVGASTELSVGGDRRYYVYDDSWHDLGPSRPSTQTQRAAPDSLATLSSGDFLEHLKRVAEDARTKYSKPDDPDSGA